MSNYGYPRDPEQERILEVGQLKDLVVNLLVKYRMFASDAELAADRMLESDLRGIVSHGSRALTRYLPSMEMGDIDPRAQLLTESETPAVAIINGSQGLGHIAATKGMQLAIEKAREVGTGTVVVKNSHHYGACGVYAMLAVEAGMLGYTTTTAGLPNIIVPNTRSGGETNHGIAWGCPYSGGAPIVLDMAIAESSWGKIHSFADYGFPIPGHWAWNESGEPTTEASQATLLHPIAGPKGFGLAFFSSILTGGLSGRKLAIDKTRPVAIEGGEHFFQAIDISKFVDEDQFQKQLASAVEKIQALPPDENSDSVQLPGQQEWEQAQSAQENGIPLHVNHVSELEELARNAKVEIPWE